MVFSVGSCRPLPCSWPGALWSTWWRGRCIRAPGRRRSAGNLRLAMPQSRTRYQRAAIRSKYRKPKRRRSGSFGWNVAIGMLVVVGVVSVFLVRGGGDSAGSGAPRAADAANNVAGDHWHTALDVDMCGEWLDPAPAFEKP